MTYIILAIFINGNVAVEESGVTLLECAGRAAMLREQARPLFPLIGEVKYLCVPEKK